MEVAGSALSGALRVGVQIVSTAKRPVMEVYQQVRNVIHPEVEYKMPDHTFKDRRQETMITLTAVNVGTLRAENVSFRIQPGLRRGHGQDFGELFNTVLPTFAPGQAMFLLSFNEFDLWNYEYETPSMPDGVSVGRPSTLKTENLPILIEYDGPWSGLNRVMRLWSHFRKRRQYKWLYRFNPHSVMTDLPVPESI